jgi:hypothetical protein
MFLKKKMIKNKFISVTLNCLVLFTVLTISSCQSQTETTSPSKKDVKDVIELNDQVSVNVHNSLDQWGLSSKVEVGIEKNEISIDILYLNKEPFFTDVYSNELVVKTLVFKHKEELLRFETINISLAFDGFIDSADYNLDKDKLKIIDTFFADADFYHNVDYSLTQFTPSNIRAINSLIKFIVEQSDMEVENRNYWELLNDFTSFCSLKDETKLKQAELFIVLLQMMKNVDYQDAGIPKLMYMKFEKILKSGNLSLEILDLKSFDDIHESLSGLIE